MTRKRIKFCKKYLIYTPKQWENLVSPNKSTFRLVNSRGMKVRRPSGLNHYKQRFTIATVKHSASVMVWGCFSGKKGRGGLYFLPKNQTMNGECYKRIPGKPPPALHADLRCHLLPPGWHAMLLEQICYEQAEGDG
jgi:hypothetical protein